MTADSRTMYAVTQPCSNMLSVGRVTYSNVQQQWSEGKGRGRVRRGGSEHDCTLDNVAH